MGALAKKAAWSYKLSLLFYSGLLLTLMAKTWLLDPPPGSLWFATVIQVVPLLLPVVGLLRRQPRSAAWLCFILCFYFTSGVLAVWLTPLEVHEWLVTGFSAALFTSAMLFTRWQGQLSRR